MLDFDLAALYEVETKVLKQAVKRNLDRFPKDFMFELSKEEFERLRSQFVTSKRGGMRYQPFAFTEQGVSMLASVLRSHIAIQVSIAIIRAFVLMRQHLTDYKELKESIAAIENDLSIKLKDIYQVLDYLLKEKERELLQKDRKMIGYK
jgi:hypothetical protein